MQIDPKLLRSIPALSAIPIEVVETLSLNAKLLSILAGKLLAQQGTSPGELYYVIKGQLNALVVDDTNRLVGHGLVNMGESVGWLSVIDGKPLNASLVATVDSEVLLVPHEVARSSLLPIPAINNAVLQLMAQGIRRHMDERRVLTLSNAFQRVYMHLYNLVQNTDADKALLPKQQEIAMSANTSRETVSRAIQLLVKRGVLLKQGHQIVVVRQDKLKAMATTGASEPDSPGNPASNSA